MQLDLSYNQLQGALPAVLATGKARQNLGRNDTAEPDRIPMPLQHPI